MKADLLCRAKIQQIFHKLTGSVFFAILIVFQLPADKNERVVQWENYFCPTLWDVPVLCCNVWTDERAFSISKNNG